MGDVALVAVVVMVCGFGVAVARSGSATIGVAYGAVALVTGWVTCVVIVGRELGRKTCAGCGWSLLDSYRNR